MEKLIDQFLQEAEIPANKLCEEDGDTIYNTDFELKGGTFRLCIVIASEYQNVTLLLSSPIKVPPPKKAEVAEYIAMANFHSYEGGIIMDYNDGDLAFKYSMRYDPENEMSHIPYQLNISLSVAFDEMEKHFPAMLSIIYNHKSPEQAFSQAELGTNPELN